METNVQTAKKIIPKPRVDNDLSKYQDSCVQPVPIPCQRRRLSRFSKASANILVEDVQLKSLNLNNLAQVIEETHGRRSIEDKDR